jgi:hypothetical protein
MIRVLPVLLILVVLIAGIGLALWRCVECPECPAEGPCLRCGDRHRITLLESRRRLPLHPTLRSLVQSTGTTAKFLGTLAEAQGLPRRHYLGWKEHDEFFYFARATMVEGPDGPLVLAVLSAKVMTMHDDSGKRVLLFARDGRELARCDLSLPESLGDLDATLQYGPPASVLLFVQYRVRERVGPIVIASGSTPVTLERKDWPEGWDQGGVVRIVARDGRLVVTSP